MTKKDETSAEEETARNPAVKEEHDSEKFHRSHCLTPWVAPMSSSGESTNSESDPARTTTRQNSSPEEPTRDLVTLVNQRFEEKRVVREWSFKQEKAKSKFPLRQLSLLLGKSHYGYFFQLLVDNVPIQEIIGPPCGGMPCWMALDGLPKFDSDDELEFPSTRIIAVCDCGEDGCGHIRCEVSRKDDLVVFSDFTDEQGNSCADTSLTFTLGGFRDAESDMFILGSRIQEHGENLVEKFTEYPKKAYSYFGTKVTEYKPGSDIDWG